MKEIQNYDTLYLKVGMNISVWFLLSKGNLWYPLPSLIQVKRCQERHSSIGQLIVLILLWLNSYIWK